MAPVLDGLPLVMLGALLTIIAVAAVPISRRTARAPSAVTGAAAGACLFGAATWSVIAAIV